MLTIPNPSLSKVTLSIGLSKTVVDKFPLKSDKVLSKLSVTTPSKRTLERAFNVSKDCVISTPFILVIFTLGLGIASFFTGSPK